MTTTPGKWRIEEEERRRRRERESVMALK